ncbi:MAG TPA: hypothetical protein VKY57_00505 [Chitinispirillaceae bacterium]|nr:hypothetical protein [Chitinispirillaceae bacterium]
MVHYRFIPYLVALISFLFILCAPQTQTCQIHDENSKKVSLEWKPNLRIDDFDLEPLKAYKSFVFEIPVITDNREKPAIIGKILEDKLIADKYIPLYTPENMSKWLTQSIINALNFLGIQGVSKKGNLIIEKEISRFYLVDDLKQRGEMSFRVNVRSSNNMLVWEGAISGSSELYSHPKGSDGISECLSNTILKTVYNMLTDNSFRDAVISVK